MLLHAPTREAIQQVSAIMVTLIREPPRTEQKSIAPPTPRMVNPVIPRIELPPLPAFDVADAPVNRASAAAPAPTPASSYVTPPAIVRQVIAAPITPPRFDADYLENPAPAYPALSRRLGEEGRVVLRVRVEANGAASDIQIATSSHFDRLDQAAIDAVRRWRFVPAKQDDQTIAAWVLVPLNFSLRG
jgi:protein TonB